MKIFEEGTGAELPPAPTSSEPAEVDQPVDQVALKEAAVTEAVSEPVAGSTEFSPAQRSKLRLATALNVGLSSVGGAWLAAVPGAVLTTGEALDGALYLSAALAAVLGGFFRYHPLIPQNYHITSYGLMAVRRSDGMRRHFALGPLESRLSPQDRADNLLWELPRTHRAVLAEQNRKERKLRRRAIRLDRRAAEVRADILGIERELLERGCLNGDPYDSRRELLEQPCIKRSNHG